MEEKKVLLKYTGKLKEPRQVYAPFPMSGVPVIFNPYGFVPESWVTSMLHSGKFVLVDDVDALIDEGLVPSKKEEKPEKNTSPQEEEGVTEEESDVGD